MSKKHEMPPYAVASARRYKRDNQRKTKLRRVVAFLACVVVFCTTYAMILPALTSRTEVFCGYEEHSHGVECYRPLGSQERVLSCSLQSLEVHTHGLECYGQDGALICGTADFVSHTHESHCYDDEGVLLCVLEERSGHVHGAECYAAVSGQPEETEAPTQTHSHDETCYALSRGALLCTQSEEGHSHGQECYGQELICDSEQEGHIHEEQCYAPVLECDLSEAPEHSHEDSCYEQLQELICTIEELQEVPSEATDASTEAFQIPTAQELVCTEIEAQVHVHGEDCFSELQGTLTCTLEENESHSHTELCYGIWELICSREEHHHGPSCYSDPTADLETAEEWESAFRHLSLSGNWRRDVLAIANTQLGYEESQKNYLVTENGTQKGYSRYGAWYGDPYGDWCAMFASFCIHYGKVEGIPIHSSCTAWIRDLKRCELFRLPDEYEPQPGDLVFFDWEEDGVSDHVGFVSELRNKTEDTAAVLVALEGNAANKVQYVSYDPADKRIVGYGMLSREPLRQVLCDLQEHSHGTACYDEAGALICTEVEHSHTDACSQYKLVYNDNIVCAFVTIENGGELPPDLSLKVTPVLQEENEETFNSMQAAVSKKMESRTEYVGAVAFYSLQLMSEGQPYDPPENMDVTVDLSFDQPVFTAEEVEKSSGMRTYVVSPEPMVDPGSEQLPIEQSVPSGGTGNEKPATKNPTGSLTETMETPTDTPIDGERSEELISVGELTEEMSYKAETALSETIMEPEVGITGVSYRSGEIATLALALTTETQSGEFWTRVSSVSEITSDGVYMIVSAQGNYALRGNNTNNYTAVTLRTVKDNEEYYTITNSTDTNLRWVVSGNNGSMTIRNQGSSQYLYMETSGSWFNRTNVLISSSSNEMTLSYQTKERCWRISDGSDYLRNTGTGAFSFGTSNDGQYNSSNVYYYSRDMLIFKLSSVTSLEVPVDVTDEDTSSGGSSGIAPGKPDYGNFVKPSGSKTGETAVTNTDGGTTVSIKGEYYSDPATSDIEKNYRTETFAESEANDGRVLTDKSVIYMDDDYGAFEHYDANTFGVTLSTIGQEYKVPYQENVVTPVDVVFILDVSGSMKDLADPNASDTSGQSRAQALVEATNIAIDEIMNNHDANRVGLAIYSGGAWELLPLDRYTATNKAYLQCVVETETHSQTNQSIVRHNVKGGATLKNAAGVSFANVGDDAEQGLGTYTQAGIAMGRKIFEDNDDITYTTQVGFGEYIRPYTVNRQPVFILLSDGEPTYSTNIYMDPLSGPHYGDGEADIDNAKGIHGYYTVLTANYCKRMVSIHYQKPALFYTVGMGIFTPEEGDGPNSNDTSNTGDNYKRAVLNPTVENIENLTSNLNATQSTDMLKEMMLSNYSGQAVSVLSQWPETWMGIPHTYLPVLQGNPYSSNYSYADGAYFGNISSEELAEIFSDILESSLKLSPYGFILYKNSAIDMVDNIGAGMEIKGTPVLRYNGTNYRNPTIQTAGNITTYIYNEINVDPHIPGRENDLSQITVKVTENDDGTQTVEMYVPDMVLPTYTPELFGLEYYYEMLPVRLIYQVGLTEVAKQQVLALEGTGDELTFYTNKWKNSEDMAISTLVPSDYNPYYIDVDPDDGILPGHQEHWEAKTDNATGTFGLVVDCHKYSDAELDNRIRIVHTLGNNGKLVFRSEATRIPVEKAWENVNPDIMNPVTFDLYKVTESVLEDGSTKTTGVLVDSKTLNAEKQWQELFDGVAIPDGTWFYVLVERMVPGYQAFYQGDLIRFTVDESTLLTGVKLDLTSLGDAAVRVTNAPATELPSTGGPGIIPYTIGGTLLTSLAVILLMYNSKNKRRKGDMLPL